MMSNIRKCSFWVKLTIGNKSKHKVKGFTHKLKAFTHKIKGFTHEIKAFTPVFDKLLFPFI